MIFRIIHREAFLSLGTFSTYTYGYVELGYRKSVVHTGSAFAQNHLFKWGNRGAS